MPLGNGRLTALAWANASAGGIGVMLAHQDAMSSATEPFKLGLVQLALTPNPFDAGAFFNQTLDLETASVFIYAGGTSLADFAVSIRVWADANADGLYIDIASGDGKTTYSIAAALDTLRPTTNYSYTLQFSSCSTWTSQPDVFVDPLPAPVSLPAPRALSAEDRFRRASEIERPSSILIKSGTLTPGARVGFLPGSVAIYHRNADSDGLTVNETLTQQVLYCFIYFALRHIMFEFLHLNTHTHMQTDPPMRGCLYAGPSFSNRYDTRLLAGQPVRLRPRLWRWPGAHTRFSEPACVYRTGCCVLSSNDCRLSPGGSQWMSPKNNLAHTNTD
jgi:hypothetical protein